MSDTERHFSLEEIQALAEGLVPPAAREHLDGCARCRRELELAGRMDRALKRFPRTPADPLLAARIVRALPAPVAYAAMEWQSFLLGMAAAVLVLFGLVLLHEVITEVQANGAFDLLSLYASRPEFVTNYPGETLNALIEIVPVFELGLGFFSLILSGALLRRFWVTLPPAHAPLSKKWLP